MAIEQVSCHVVRCDHDGCDALLENGDGVILHFENTKEIDLYDWYGDENGHICCPDCSGYCWWCNVVHGKHTDDCSYKEEE